MNIDHWQNDNDMAKPQDSEKNMPTAPLLQPQIQGGVCQFRTRVSAVKGWTITARATARSNATVLFRVVYKITTAELFYFIQKYIRRSTLRFTYILMTLHVILT